MMLKPYEENYIHKRVDHEELKRKAARIFRSRKAPINSELVNLANIAGAQLLAEYNGNLDETEYWIS